MAIRCCTRPEQDPVRALDESKADLYVEEGCCLACGVPWHYAPEIFADGNPSCVVRRMPATATEFRKVLRVLKTQEVGCIRYAGSDSRVLTILSKAGCAEHCDMASD